MLLDRAPALKEIMSVAGIEESLKSLLDLVLSRAKHEPVMMRLADDLVGAIKNLGKGQQ